MNLKDEAPETSKQDNNSEISKVSRRKFVTGAAVAAVAAAIPLEPLVGGKESQAEASVASYGSGSRANASYNYRVRAANAEYINQGVLPDNGDWLTFTDFSGNYSKALSHDALGVPNANSWLSFRNALSTGKFSDFENVIVGTPGGGPNSRENGPQGSFALDLEGLDSHATNIPPAPSVASAQTAAEQVEHYWGALLRDLPFGQYASSSLAAQACKDLNKLSYLQSSQNYEFPYPVTPSNLFRGQIVPGDGNVQGPYLSQFFVQPTFFGAQPLSQKHQTFLSLSNGGADYMTSVSEFQTVQNGGDSGRQLAYDPTFRYARNGRDLAAYTHVDVLYQAYFTAALIMLGIGVPLNPGNPYGNSNTQKPFGTLGGPDIVGTLGEMATRALKAAWFHKWVVNLRMRPEEYGALVQARLTQKASASHFPQAAAALHPDVLNSAALPNVFSKHGTYLLPLAFPEGSPTHPCYPTGHGTVGGACITALKFFFDCSQKIRPLLVAAGTDVAVPSNDGTSLNTYSGNDSDTLDVNGELAKLAYNVTFGHGIHAGIHFRSSSYWSILLGEQVALSILQDRARGYSEPFTVSITKFDGTTAIISNQ